MKIGNTARLIMIPPELLDSTAYTVRLSCDRYGDFAVAVKRSPAQLARLTKIDATAEQEVISDVIAEQLGEFGELSIAQLTAPEAAA